MKLSDEKIRRRKRQTDQDEICTASWNQSEQSKDIIFKVLILDFFSLPCVEL